MPARQVQFHGEARHRAIHPHGIEAHPAVLGTDVLRPDVGFLVYAVGDHLLGDPGQDLAHVRVTDAGAPALATIPPADYPPPSNVIPPPAALDHPIMQTRREQGSPLAGTVLSEPDACGDDQHLFVAALEKVAASMPVADIDCQATPPAESTCSASPILTQLTAHLYAMAQIDEEAAQYERADQWRALARELRRD